MVRPSSQPTLGSWISFCPPQFGGGVVGVGVGWVQRLLDVLHGQSVGHEYPLPEAGHCPPHTGGGVVGVGDGVLGGGVGVLGC